MVHVPNHGGNKSIKLLNFRDKNIELLKIRYENIELLENLQAKY